MTKHDDYMDDPDDEQIEDEYGEGFIVMTKQEFIEWCRGEYEGEDSE